MTARTASATAPRAGSARRAATTDDWACPHCGRRFRRTAQAHSCSARSTADFFAAYPDAARLFPAVRRALQRLGEVDVSVTKTQVTFRRRGGTGFAWLWIPHMALRRGPPDLFLAFGLPRRIGSTRIKEASETKPGWYTHHLKVASASDLDDEAKSWLQEAYLAAGRGRPSGRPA